MKSFVLAVLLAVSSVVKAAPADTEDQYYKKVLPGLSKGESIYIDLYKDALRLSGAQDKYCTKFPNECRTMPIVKTQFLPGNVLGQFDENDATYIRISPFLKPGSLFWKVTLVHEFTHYIDWRFGNLKNAATCLEAVASEEHAYEVGRLWLKEHGVETNYGKMNTAMMKADCVDTGR